MADTQQILIDALKGALESIEQYEADCCGEGAEYYIEGMACLEPQIEQIRTALYAATGDEQYEPLVESEGTLKDIGYGR